MGDNGEYPNGWEFSGDMPNHLNSALNNLPQQWWQGALNPPPQPTVTPQRPAASMLHEAARISDGAREKNGAPERTFATIAVLWNAYLASAPGGDLTAADVARMLVLFKMGRGLNAPPNRDTYVDMAAYAALAGELACDE